MPSRGGGSEIMQISTKIKNEIAEWMKYIDGLSQMERTNLEAVADMPLRKIAEMGSRATGKAIKFFEAAGFLHGIRQKSRKR